MKKCTFILNFRVSPLFCVYMHIGFCGWLSDRMCLCCGCVPVSMNACLSPNKFKRFTTNERISFKLHTCVAIGSHFNNKLFSSHTDISNVLPPSSIQSNTLKNENSKHFWNVGLLQRDHTALYTRRLRYLCSRFLYLVISTKHYIE
jgi:hypothetical protein